MMVVLAAMVGLVLVLGIIWAVIRGGEYMSDYGAAARRRPPDRLLGWNEQDTE